MDEFNKIILILGASFVAMVSMTAIQCKLCGASYQAMAGYSAKCPYCGGYTNA